MAVQKIIFWTASFKIKTMETQNNSFHSQNNEKIFTMKASQKYLIITNLSGLILGSLIVFLFRKEKILFFLTFTILLIYMVGDFLIWLKIGIREIWINDKEIIFLKGNKKEKITINFKEIKDIDFFDKLGRRIINIIIEDGKKIKLTPYITFFSGKRIRITDDAFNDKEFSNFVEKLKNIELRIKSQAIK